MSDPILRLEGVFTNIAQYHILQGVDLEVPRQVGTGEEEITHFCLDMCLISLVYFGFELFKLLDHLVDDAMVIRPVETNLGRLFTDFGSLHQAGQVGRYIIQQARMGFLPGFLLCSLDFIPPGDDFTGRIPDLITEHMRMTADHLVDDTGNNVTKIEVVFL